MLQYLGSYIWGAEEECAQEEIHEYEHEEVEIENEWLYIPRDNENRHSSTEDLEDEDDDRTFNLAECNLFHYEEEMNMNLCSPVEERLQEIEKAAEKSMGKRGVLSKRVPLKDLNAKVAIIKKKDSPKNLKRSNFVQMRNTGARKNKQMGRMQGKHTAMVAPRTR